MRKTSNKVAGCVTVCPETLHIIKNADNVLFLIGVATLKSVSLLNKTVRV